MRTVGEEIEEGFLECRQCGLVFPIIGRIPIMYDDFTRYIAHHRILGGRLYLMTDSPALKEFIRASLRGQSMAVPPPPVPTGALSPSQPRAINDNDRTLTEDRWSKIYQNSQDSKFYSVLRQTIHHLPRSKIALEYGCSIGLTTLPLADSSDTVFGIDTSFSALQIAKSRSSGADGDNYCNLDYILADALSPIFGTTKFDLILALNVLEIIEPVSLLRHMSRQITRGHIIMSDPYDFERGLRTVANTLDESSLRSNLRELGFDILPETRISSHIPWHLHINRRATIHYEVDLVVCERH